MSWCSILGGRWSVYVKTDTLTVATANKSYFAGEFDWVGSNDGGVTPNGDDLSEWFSVIEESPVAAGEAFWSLLVHDVPNCNVSMFSSCSPMQRKTYSALITR